MRTIRITHHSEGPHGWWFTSPDLPGLVGGPPNDADYDASCRFAEEAVRFALECEAEERGAPEAEPARVVHLVPTSA